jgi:hypothetical protein
MIALTTVFLFVFFFFSKGSSPPPNMSKTNSATWTTESKAAKLRTHSFKLRHESKSTNDVRNFGADVKAKHQMLVRTKAECVGELTQFLPTLTATADSLAQGIELQHCEVRPFVLFF